MADSSVQARFVFPDSALEVCSTRFKGNKIAGLRYGRDDGRSTTSTCSQSREILRFQALWRSPRTGAESEISSEFAKPACC